MDSWDLSILKSTTCYLNKTEMRAWAHFPVVEEIDGRGNEGEEGLGGVDSEN